MLSRYAAEKRWNELRVEFKAKQDDIESGRITDDKYIQKYLARTTAELNELTAILKEHDQVRKYAYSAEAGTDGFPESRLPGMHTKAINGTPVHSWEAVGQSPAQLSDSQTKALIQAALNRTPCRIEVGKKGMESVWSDGIQTKAPTMESGLNTNLPPIIQPTRAMGLPYEPARIMGYLPAAAMNGPSAAWLQHTGNTNEAGGVGEGQLKPDLGAQFREYIAYPQKIAGLATVTLEFSMDYPEMGNLLQTELQRSVINQESLFLLQGNYSGGPTSVFNGLLATSGTLQRSVGSDTPLDALNKSFVDLRVGAAFCDPDLVILHPTTWASLRREKDDQGRYILDMLSGPRGLTYDGQQHGWSEPEPFGVTPQGVSTPYGSLWGVPVVETTQCPAGTGVVLSTKAGGAIGWTRMGMVVEYDPYAGVAGLNFAENLYTWRCEERISLTTPRPSAINIVTGLPTS